MSFGIFGTCTVVNGKVRTRRKVYPLNEETHAEVNLIFKAPAIIAATGLCFFGVGFSDLLYPSEIFVIVVAALFLILLGFQLACLQIHDRVTRGTQDATAIYGLDYKLQDKLAEIYDAIPEHQGGGS